MKTVFLALGFYLSIATCVTAQDVSDNWHQWRGPEANGVSRTAKPPTEWSEDKNIQWKAPIPGRGSSVPIIWEDKVFVLTAVKTEEVDPSLTKPEDQPKANFFDIKKPNAFHDFVVMCLDRESGAVKWKQVANNMIPHEGVHNDNDFASASPVTDGKRLYCWFGSAGLYCYDLDGNLIWQRDLGKAFMGSSLGEGCSPVVHDGKLVIVRDQSKQSTIETLDAATGKTLWKKERDEDNAWATPRIVRHSGKTQVITAASNRVRSYDLENGDIIWQASGLTGNCIPCPVVDGDYVLCMSGYKGYSLLALPLMQTGDISGSDKIRWSTDKGTPYIPSPLLYDGMLYYNQSNQAILTCVDSKTGDPIINRKRLSDVSNLYASPVGADGRVYITGRNGTTVVLNRGKEFNVLATNKLSERCDSSVAIAGNQLFLRGRNHLYCVSEKK